ncbi:hypothetical protein EVAR_80680_1 [Eumeta japonica]|uniref:Uncharacterized protein n=1 Tax=Eumeta variegata TaxID=151549 RepID=A0A4C1U3F9_EUMVA|nr:hypothetical protein EVAR_80680_1 [Eumeta japonica]
MSRQGYYKERLGFDPDEKFQDGVNGNAYYEDRHQAKRHRGEYLNEGTHDQNYEDNLTKFKGTTCWEFFIRQAELALITIPDLPPAVFRHQTLSFVYGRPDVVSNELLCASLQYSLRAGAACLSALSRRVFRKHLYFLSPFSGPLRGFVWDLVFIKSAAVTSRRVGRSA